MAPSPTRPSPETLLNHVEWVKRLARLLVSDANDAADVEQETWRLALERPPERLDAERDADGSVRRWLAAVARNVARKLVRSQETREHHERNVASVHAAAAASEVTARAELHRRVVEAVLGLDEMYRAPLLLRFFDDLSAQEVALRLGLPVETARTRIKRGLALLRAQLGGSRGLERIAGLLMGGFVVSKVVKVSAAVVVTGAALFGTYKLWIAPRLPEHPLVDTAKAAAGTPTPAKAPPEVTPAPAVVASTREEIERTKGEGATAPAVAAHATIEGSVMDATGHPVAGATVAVDRAAKWNGDVVRRQMRHLLDVDDRGHALFVCKSADDGSFRFEGLDAGVKWAVAALHDPIGMGWNDAIDFTGDPPHARVTILLQAGTVLFGNVRDELGKPVESASVLLHGVTADPDPEDNGWGGEFEDFLVSAADGSYRSLPLAWRHVKLQVYVHGSEALGQVTLPWEALPAGVSEVRRDLVVPALATLRGRILGPDGQPARLATTLVPKLGEDARRNQTRQTIAAAAFAEDPRLRPELVERLGTNEPGIVFLDADHTYGSVSLAEDRFEVPLRSATLRFVAIVARNQLLGVAEIPQPPVDTDITIDPSRLPARSLMHGLRLHLRDGRDGAPLEGVSLYAQTIGLTQDGGLTMSILNFGREPKLTPDRDLELPRTPLTIQMRCGGFVPRTVAIDASRAGAPTELTIDFVPAAGAIAVHLADEGGQPIAGASLRVYQLAAEPGAELQPVVFEGQHRTDEHGVATIQGLPAGDCLVVAQAEGYASAATHATIAAPDAAADASADGGRAVPVPAELVMARGYEITLLARLADGALARNGQLALLTEAGVPLYDEFHPSAGCGVLAGRKLRVVDGIYVLRCRVPALADGTTKIVAAPGASVAIELAPTDHP